MRVFLIFLILFSGALYARETPQILRMFEEFTMSSAAAGKCIKPEKSELTSFLANYQMVSTMALKQLKEMKPGITDEKASSVLKGGGEHATKTAYSIIKNEGCQNQKVQALIERFHAQAKWKP